jgi:hypothetical protein
VEGEREGEGRGKGRERYSNAVRWNRRGGVENCLYIVYT